MQFRISLGLAIAMFSSIVQAQTYHLTALGDNANVSAINDLGQIVGTDYASPSGTQEGTLGAYLWSGGKSTSLGYGIQTANDINNHGQITGAIGTDPRATGSSVSHAYLFSGGQVTDLDPTDRKGIGSAGLAINNHGVVAGFYLPDSSTQNSVAATFANGHITDLGVPPGAGGYSLADAINDKGDVAGSGGVHCGGSYCGFVLSGGKTTYIKPPDGYEDTFAYGINSFGMAVGTSMVTSGNSSRPAHAIAFGDGVTKDLTSGSNDDGESDASAINDAGAIVGTDAKGAFLYTGGKMHDLNTMLDGSGKGWTLSLAKDINNLGQIVGVGTDAAGLTRAFVLSPVPEIGTWAMMLMGLVVGNFVRRGRRGSKVA